MANGSNEKKEKLVGSILTARRYAVTLITSAFGLKVILSEYERIKQMPVSLLNYSYLSLLGIVCFLVFAWIWVTEDELNLLTKWLEPSEQYEPPRGIKETFIILGLCLLLVSLFLFARDVFYFSIVFTAYSVAVLFSVRHMNRQQLKPAFEGMKNVLNRQKEVNPKERKIIEKRQEGLLILENYFLLKPHTKRHIIILAFSILGLVSSILWKMGNDNLFGIISYVLFFLIILFSEFVIFSWRIERDNGLTRVKREMRTLGVDPP